MAKLYELVRSPRAREAAEAWGEHDFEPGYFAILNDMLLQNSELTEAQHIELLLNVRDAVLKRRLREPTREWSKELAPNDGDLVQSPEIVRLVRAAALPFDDEHWVADRLAQVVTDNEKRIMKENLEWVVGEVGNLEDEGWEVFPAELHPAVIDGETRRGLDGQPFRFTSKYPHRYGYVMDYAPEWLQRDLTSEMEDMGIESPSFVTIWVDGDAPEGLVDVKDRHLYQRVYSGGRAAEVECPNSDMESGNDSDGIVSVESTYYGEYPNERCRFCEGKIGEEHGMLYIGEGAEYVYVKVPLLGAQVQNEESEEAIAELWESTPLYQDEYELVFENGRWWVLTGSMRYRVFDTELADRFDFERVG